jgi:muconolactone delta-isomerase
MYFITEFRVNRAAMPEKPPSDREYEQEQIKKGKLLMAFGAIGGPRSYFLWNVESPEELRTILQGFPLAKWLEWDTHPVALMPCFKEWKIQYTI